MHDNHQSLPQERPAGVRRRVLWLLELTATVLVLGLLVQYVGGVPLLHTLFDADLRWIGLMLLTVFAGRWLEAAQMARLLRRIQAPVGVTRVFLANTLSALYSLVVPGDLVAGVAKWSNLSAATGKKSAVLNAIVYNRIALLFPSLLLGVVALLWENPFGDGIGTVAAVLFGVLLIGLAVMLYHPRLGLLTDRLLRGCAHRLPRFVGRRCIFVVENLERFRRLTPADHGVALLIGFLAAGAAQVAFICACRAFGVSIPFTTIVWLNAVILLARQMPITIGNFGVREGLLILVLGRYGVEPERAFAIGIAKVINHLAFALVGASYQLALFAGWAAWTPTPERRPAPPDIAETPQIPHTN